MDPDPAKIISRRTRPDVPRGICGGPGAADEKAPRRPPANRADRASTLSGLLQIGKAVVKMDIEARLVRAHVELYVRRRDERASNSVSVARYGAYEVRLLQVVQGSCAHPFIFWIELFDHNRGVSLDSGSAENLEKALGVAEELVSHAERLNKR